MNACNIKALILDFDYTLFNTDADREVRKNSKVKDWDLIYSKNRSISCMMDGVRCLV